MTGTLANYAQQWDGEDTAYVGRWNFSAKGEDDDDFYNKGFTFDLFNGTKISAMDAGSKSFVFTGGGSDVAISYNVKMQLQDLLKLPLLTGQTVAGYENVSIYLPLIFRIELAIIEDAVEEDQLPVLLNGGGWFRARDIEVDEDGYFELFEDGAFFEKGSYAKVWVTVYWQWNASYYISDAIDAFADVQATSAVNGNGTLRYYTDAYDAYYGPGGLLDTYRARRDAVDAYRAEHGLPDEGGAWEHDVDGAPCPDNGPAHYAAYESLVNSANAAQMACESSLLSAYDDYDTLAVDALIGQELRIEFQIYGLQIAPEQGGGGDEPQP